MEDFTESEEDQWDGRTRIPPLSMPNSPYRGQLRRYRYNEIDLGSTPPPRDLNPADWDGFLGHAANEVPQQTPSSPDWANAMPDWEDSDSSSASPVASSSSSDNSIEFGLPRRASLSSSQNSVESALLRRSLDEIPNSDYDSSDSESVHDREAAHQEANEENFQEGSESSVPSIDFASPRRLLNEIRIAESNSSDSGERIHDRVGAHQEAYEDYFQGGSESSSRSASIDAVAQVGHAREVSILSDDRRAVFGRPHRPLSARRASSELPIEDSPHDRIEDWLRHSPQSPRTPPQYRRAPRARAELENRVNAGEDVEDALGDMVDSESDHERHGIRGLSPMQAAHRPRLSNRRRGLDQLVGYEVFVASRRRANGVPQAADVIDLTGDSDDGLLFPDNPRFNSSPPRVQPQNNRGRNLNPSEPEGPPPRARNLNRQNLRGPGHRHPSLLQLPAPRLNPIEIDLTSDNNQANMAEADNQAPAARRPANAADREVIPGRVIIDLLSDDDDDHLRPPAAINRAPQPREALRLRTMHNVALEYLQGLGGLVHGARRDHAVPMRDFDLLLAGAPNPLGDNLPNLNYGAHAYDTPMPPHIPPAAAREGYTRDTGEDDKTIVCPSCAKELVYDPDDAGVSGRPAKRMRSRKDYEEHFFWAVKECGHVFCKSCFELRKDEDLPFVHDNKKIRCAVENCNAEVTQRAFWVGLFL